MYILSYSRNIWYNHDNTKNIFLWNTNPIIVYTIWLSPCVGNIRNRFETVVDQLSLKMFLIEKVMWHFWVTKYDQNKNKWKETQKYVWDKIQEK